MTTIATWIEAHAPSDRVAFRFEGAAISYREFAGRIAATAEGLSGSGVGSGDRVVYCGLNRVETFEILLACARLGAMMVPLNNRLSVGELAAQINDSDPTVLVATDGFASTLRSVAAGRVVRDLDTDPLYQQPFDPQSHVGDVSQAPTGGAASTRSEDVADLMASTTDLPLLMVYTSGTTGTPKGALLSQRALLATVLNGIDHQQLTDDDRVLAPLPTFHVGGLNIQTLPALYVGAEVLLMRRFDPELLIDLIEEFRPTQGLLVPAMLAAVAASSRFAKVDLSSMRGICTGSSIVPESLVLTYLDRGVPLGQVYGATETGPTAVVLAYDEVAARPTSCGRPARHTEMRIVDELGREVGPQVGGEIWLRGPNLFSGYWKNPEATAAAFSDGWYRTGDVGYLDAEGYCYITDRLTDVVISGGENIYPAEVEAVLIDHPAISEVAVIARADQKWGEVPLAIVVPTPGHRLELTELRSWCDDRLARYKQPKALEVVEALPRTALGKVQKHVLRTADQAGASDQPGVGEPVSQSRAPNER